MDFHSLTRRQLQALCKKNKIPANTKNIVMTDALKALDIVEGMEEFYNPSSVVSAGNTAMASLYVPCTGGRTSTRKKTIKEESKSVQITTRARRGTRKTMAGEAEDAKIDVAETPGIQSIRKIEPVASGFREIETPRNQKEISLKKMNTLRSTSLLKKQAMELNLNDKERIKPIDFGGSDIETTNDMEGNMKENSDDFGLNQETISIDEVVTKIDELEALLDELPDKLSENARELEQISEVLHESDLASVLEEHTHRLTPQMITDIDDGVDDANKVCTDQNGDDELTPQMITDANKVCTDQNGDHDGDYDNAPKKLGEGPEGYDKSDILSGENLEKSQDLKPEVPDEEGCDNSGCIDNTAERLVSENDEEGFNTEKYCGSKDSGVMDIGGGLVSEDSEEMEFGALNLSVSAASEYQKQDIELQNQAIDESEMKHMDDLESTLTGEDNSKEGKLLAYDAAAEFDHREHSICYKQLGREKEINLVTLNCGEESAQLTIGSSYEIVLPTVESSDQVSLSSLDKSPIAEVLIDMPFSTLATDSLWEPMLSSLFHPGSDSDCLNKTPTTSRKINSLLDENENIDNSGRKLELTQEERHKDKNEAPDSSKNKSLRQLKKILKERVQITKTTSRKIKSFLDENMENIDNNGKKLELAQEKGHKDKNEVPDSIKNKSLRQLKKILKERVQIRNKKCGESSSQCEQRGS